MVEQAASRAWNGKNVGTVSLHSSGRIGPMWRDDCDGRKMWPSTARPSVHVMVTGCLVVGTRRSVMVQSLRVCYRPLGADSAGAGARCTRLPGLARGGGVHARPRPLLEAGPQLVDAWCAGPAGAPASTRRADILQSMFRHVRAFGFALLMALAARAGTSAQTRSFVVVGAQVADGSGGPLRPANVRVNGDTIVAVGAAGEVTPGAGETVVDGTGLVLAPGFIDAHNHSTEGLEKEPAAITQVSQGITTLAVGQDGSSPWPLAGYIGRLRATPPAVNVVVLAGHATIRQQVMGADYKRKARPAENARMRALVDQAMTEGAFGLSSGLEYEVGSYADIEEVVEMARAAGAQGGVYISHIRDEADLTMDAVREAIAVGERAKLPVQITACQARHAGRVGQGARGGGAGRGGAQARCRRRPPTPIRTWRGNRRRACSSPTRSTTIRPACSAASTTSAAPGTCRSRAGRPIRTTSASGSTKWRGPKASRTSRPTCASRRTRAPA